MADASDVSDASGPTAADVVRAWRDPLFRASLDDLARAALPAHPSGVIGIPGLERD
nr:mersacidin/lichenicidin family type 2 lantibiotic [Streptomyces sp. NBC_00974]